MTVAKVDLSQFDEAERCTKGGALLRVDEILRDATDEERAKLLTALAAPYRASVIVKVVESWGYSLGNGAVRTWRARNL